MHTMIRIDAAVGIQINDKLNFVKLYINNYTNDCTSFQFSRNGYLKIWLDNQNVASHLNYVNIATINVT